MGVPLVFVMLEMAILDGAKQLPCPGNWSARSADKATRTNDLVMMIIFACTSAFNGTFILGVHDAMGWRRWVNAWPIKMSESTQTKIDGVNLYIICPSDWIDGYRIVPSKRRYLPTIGS